MLAIRRKYSMKVLVLLIIFAVAVFLGGCDAPLEDELDTTPDNYISGTITQLVEGEENPVEDVEVILEELDEVDYTDSQGNFSFSDIEDGEYSITFTSEEHNIDHSEIISTQTGTDHTLNLTFDQQGKIVRDEGEELEPGKEFARNLRDHGVNLEELGREQAEVVEGAFEEVALYSENVASRMELVGMILEQWIENGLEKGPGQYEFAPFDDNLELIDWEQGDSETEVWEWSLIIQGDLGQEIKIEMTNPQEIIEEETGEIDLTEAEFKYEHSAEEVEEFDWNFAFELDSDSQEEISWEEEEGEQQVIIPLDPEIEIVGYMNDSLHEDIDEFEDIGELTLDLTFALDLEEGYLSYQGELESPVFYQQGTVDVTIDDYEIPDDFEEEIIIPPIEEIVITDTFRVYDYFEVKGETEIEFTQEQIEEEVTVTMPIPESVDFEGEYNDISDNEGLEFTGNFESEMNYDNFAFTEPEGPNNYIDFNFDFDAQMKNTGFNEVNLELNISRKDYQEYSIDFDYEFEDSYMYGEGTIVGDDLEFSAVNELGQQIIIDIESENDEMKIGDLVSPEGELLAEIYVDDEPYFEFVDGEVISLVPGI